MSVDQRTENTHLSEKDLEQFFKSLKDMEDMLDRFQEPSYQITTMIDVTEKWVNNSQKILKKLAKRKR